MPKTFPMHSSIISMTNKSSVNFDPRSMKIIDKQTINFMMILWLCVSYWLEQQKKQIIKLNDKYNEITQNKEMVKFREITSIPLVL